MVVLTDKEQEQEQEKEQTQAHGLDGDSLAL
jgi:hypothetical protein